METFCGNYITAIKSFLRLFFIFHVNEFSLNYSTIESYAMWLYLKAFQIQTVRNKQKLMLLPFEMHFIYTFLPIAHFRLFVCCLVAWLVGWFEWSSEFIYE